MPRRGMRRCATFKSLKFKSLKKIRYIRLSIERIEDRSLLSANALTALFAQPLAELVAQPLASSTVPYGYTPAQIAHAYGFDQVAFGSIKGNGAGQTIAIVDAYDNPNVAADLHQFDVTFGLPDPPSFRIINQNGGTARPAADAGWAGEIALDVEWAHAIAPLANIVLVEANSNYYSDLFKAVDTAAANATVVSMSWGGSEFSSETSFDYHFNRKGVTFVASAGDSGAPAIYPAVSPYVVAVGGTSLRLGSGSTYSSEKVWNDPYGAGGGGPSRYELKPAYQKSVSVPGVATNRRLSPDVAYDADPVTGFAVYDTYQSPGWVEYGGTSAGALQWAALFAIANQGRAAAGLGSLGYTAASLYSLSTADFHDVTSGTNGYAARAGYDLATGRGTPYANRVIADLANGKITPNSAYTGTPPATSAAKLGSPATRSAVELAGFSPLRFATAARVTAQTTVSVSATVNGPTADWSATTGADRISWSMTATTAYDNSSTGVVLFASDSSAGAESAGVAMPGTDCTQSGTWEALSDLIPLALTM